MAVQCSTVVLRSVNTHIWRVVWAYFIYIYFKYCIAHTHSIRREKEEEIPNSECVWVLCTPFFRPLSSHRKESRSFSFVRSFVLFFLLKYARSVLHTHTQPCLELFEFSSFFFVYVSFSLLSFPFLSVCSVQFCVCVCSD